MTNASDLISQDRKAKIEMSFLSKILFYHISVHNTVKIIYNLIWLTSHYIIDYIIDLLLLVPIHSKNISLVNVWKANRKCEAWYEWVKENV